MMMFKERPTGIVQVNAKVVDIASPGPGPESTAVALTPDRTTELMIETAPSPPELESFRTDDDRKRTKVATEIVAKQHAAVAAAVSAVTSAEEACADDPSEGNLAKAREARRAFEDASRNLDLTRAHHAKVEGEARAAEQAAVAAQIARLEEARGQLVDDEACDLAVEIGLLSARLYDQILARKAARFAAQPAIDSLLQLIGQPTPSFADDLDKALFGLIQLAWAAQDGSTIHNGCGFFANPRGVLTLAAGSSRDESVKTYGEQAREIARRVQTRRAMVEKGNRSVVTKVAAVVGIGVLAAVKLACG